MLVFPRVAVEVARLNVCLAELNRTIPSLCRARTCEPCFTNFTWHLAKKRRLLNVFGWASVERLVSADRHVGQPQVSVPEVDEISPNHSSIYGRAVLALVDGVLAVPKRLAEPEGVPGFTCLPASVTISTAMKRPSFGVSHAWLLVCNLGMDNSSFSESLTLLPGSSILHKFSQLTTSQTNSHLRSHNLRSHRLPHSCGEQLQPLSALFSAGGCELVISVVSQLEGVRATDN